MTSALLDHLEVALGGDLKCPRGGLSVASEASLTSCRSHAKSFMATQQQHKQYSPHLAPETPPHSSTSITFLVRLQCKRSTL